MMDGRTMSVGARGRRRPRASAPGRPDGAFGRLADREKKHGEVNELLRERERTIASSATTTCLPTISGAASIRISLASLTSSAFKPILDAHASSKASAWNTLRSDTASAGLPPAVPAPETGAGCVNARCATAAGIARRSRGSIRLREPDTNPLDRGEFASRARATGSARVVGPGNQGIGLCKKARKRKRREENSESAAN